MADSKTTGVMAGVNFVLLGTELNAGFLKDDNGTRIYIFQDLDAKNEGETIDQLIKDVQALISKDETAKEPVGFDAEAIKTQLTSAAKPKEGTTFDVNSIRIVLRTVYLNIYTPKGGSTSFEFAFRLDVLTQDLVPNNIQLIRVNSLSLAIWRTENKDVLKQLSIPDYSKK